MLKNIIPITNASRYIVEINISQKCNYACDYCPLNVPGIQYTPLDIDKIMAFSHSTGWDVYIYGGEPLLHPDLFKLLDRLADKEVTIQTNLSAGIRLLSKIIKNYPNVKFALSYHYKYANFRKFLTKTKMINDAGKLLEIVFMWLSEYDDKIYSMYNICRSLYPGKSWLTPTLPNKHSPIGWITKDEFHKFLAKYPASISTFRHWILVDGIKKTILESYADNDDLNIKGVKCLINKSRISYDGDYNIWRNCAADLVYREISTGTCHRSYGCAADLGYEKHHDSNFDS